MKPQELLKDVTFQAGTYQVEAVFGDQTYPVLEMSFDGDDEAQGRRLPHITVATITMTRLRTSVANALVRAGIRHPGLEPRDLAELHSAARKHGHLELFVDINAVVQGLATQLIQSLGNRVARVVASSSTVDVFHEYQSFARRHHDGSHQTIEAWELARGLRVFRELRAPVHIHQLAPGAARYFRRSRADNRGDGNGAASAEQREETTYIAEDRQMVAGFWDYVSNGGPRIPVYLITADLSLAHVCAAEKVPFVFARAPREERDPFRPSALWFDPFSLSYRWCTAQAVLWELCLVLGAINVRAASGGNGFLPFGLRYDPRSHRPGTPEEVQRGELVLPTPAAHPVPTRPTPAVHAAPPTERIVKLSLLSIVDVLPTSAGQLVPITAFKPKDADALRQLWQIGALTRLFSQDGEKVAAGDELPKLLTALKIGDYIEVNRIFRRVPGYDRVVNEAHETGAFPSSREAGAATGWAVVLGAAYKQSGATIYGLEDVTDEQFESAILRTHAELAQRERAVPIARIVDRVCNELRISPIRFEAIMNRTLGQRGLRDFEAQRAASKAPLPAHQVLVAPTTSAPETYLRKISPGEGIIFGGKLVGSLVRRTGRQ